MPGTSRRGTSPVKPSFASRVFSKPARLAAFVVAGVSLLQPLAVWISLQGNAGHAGRWIKNSPTFTLFMPVIMAFAAYVFVAALDWSGLKEVWRLKKISFLVVFGGLWVCSIMFVSFDLERSPIEPFSRVWSGDAKDHPVVNELAAREPIRIAQLADKSTEEVKPLQYAARTTLEQAVPVFTGFADLWKSGSPAAWIAYVVNLIAAITVGSFFGYLVLLLVFPNFLNKVKQASLVVVAGCIVLFFPLRLYSEWYLNFYSFDHISNYSVFWIFLVIAVLTVIMLALLNANRTTAQVLVSIVATVVSVVSGILAKWRPEVLTYVGHQIEKASPALLLVSLFVMGLGAYAIGKRLLTSDV